MTFVIILIILTLIYTLTLIYPFPAVRGQTMTASLNTTCVMRGESVRLTCTYSQNVALGQAITIETPSGITCAIMDRVTGNCRTSSVGCVEPMYSLSHARCDTLHLTINSAAESDFGEWRCLQGFLNTDTVRLNEFGECGLFNHSLEHTVKYMRASIICIPM